MRKAAIDFRASARMDDALGVGIRCVRIGDSSAHFEGGLFLGDRLLASSELLYVFADPATQSAQPVPDALRRIFTGYEAGEPMYEVATGGWDALGAGAGPLRRAVFIDEQRVPPELEWDEHDAAGRGAREVMLHAQRSAEAFYARLGYTPRGEPFEEAGIAHIEMRRGV
jgi:hypothetical protein